MQLPMPTRRRFLQWSAAAAAAMAAPVRGVAASRAPQATVPWYQRTMRWMQTNLAVIDPTRFDLGFWREHWKRTHTQGIIINAGGIVAYYPTRVPLHRRAEFLGARDLFGEIVNAAH